MADILDTPTSTSDQTTHTFAVSAGTNRCLIVGITQEGTTLGAPTVTYGGQSMVNVIDIEINPGTTSQRVTLFFLNDAGIVAASGTTISASNTVAASVSIHAASYENAVQSTPTNTDSDSSTTATPNPLANCDIVTGAANAVVVALSGMGNSGTAAWATPLTERTDQQMNATATGSLADDEVPTATTIACECTWTTPNRHVIVALELANLDASSIEQEGYRTYDDGTESGSSARQTQDTPDTVGKDVIIQNRGLLNATGDPASQQYTLHYKEQADGDVEYRPVPLT